MESGRRGSSLNCGRELVVLPVGLVPGLFDVFVQQVVVQLVVDGLAAVARVEAGGREGEQGDGRVGRAPDVALGVVAGGRVHGPVGVYHHVKLCGKITGIEQWRRLFCAGLAVAVVLGCC